MNDQQKKQGLDLYSRLLEAAVPMDDRRGLEFRITQLRGKLILLNPFEIAIVVHFRITNLDSPFWLQGVFLTLPWTVPELRPLSDPAEFEPPQNYYQFGMDPNLIFKRNIVLNHLTGNHSKEATKILSGYRLWSGKAPIPAEYLHGSRFPTSIIFVDSLGREQSEDFEMSVDRENHYRRPRVCAKPQRNITKD